VGGWMHGSLKGTSANLFVDVSGLSTTFVTSVPPRTLERLMDQYIYIYICMYIHTYMHTYIALDGSIRVNLVL
jgi:hypothetical protein